MRGLVLLFVVDAQASDPPPIPVLGVATIFHAGYLLRCFRSIDYPVQTLVLVHNGQDEEVSAAVQTLRAERPQLRVVSVPSNSGCAGGWNRVIAARTDAPWWLIVNDDIAFPPGALRNLAARVWSRAGNADAGHYKFWYQHGATGWSCFALMARAVQRIIAWHSVRWLRCSHRSPLEAAMPCHAILLRWL